jgi:methyl-accepting chemotaxis protein
VTHRTLGPLFFDRTVGGRFYLLSGRFYPIALAMALDVVGILAISIEQTHEALGAAKGTETRHLVTTAHSLVADFQNRAQSGEMSEGAAQQEALTRLSSLRYENDRYFWVTTRPALC